MGGWERVAVGGSATESERRFAARGTGLEFELRGREEERIRRGTVGARVGGGS